MTVTMMNNSVVSITTEEGDEVTNPDYIQEFLNNSERTFYKGILDHLEIQKKNSLGYVKIANNKDSQVLFMSRSDIPNNFRKNTLLKTQVGITIFTKKALDIFAKNQSLNEDIEGIELLRVFETNLKMFCFKTTIKSKSVDYPEDLAYVKREIKKDIYHKRYKF